MNTARVMSSARTSQFAGARLTVRAARASRAARLTTSAKVGLFFATSTGNTETAADWIQQKFSGDISDPTDIGEIDVSDLTEYDSLLLVHQHGTLVPMKEEVVPLGMRFLKRLLIWISLARRLPSSVAETLLPTETTFVMLSRRSIAP